MPPKLTAEERKRRREEAKERNKAAVAAAAPQEQGEDESDACMDALLALFAGRRKPVNSDDIVLQPHHCAMGWKPKHLQALDVIAHESVDKAKEALPSMQATLHKASVDELKMKLKMDHDPVKRKMRFFEVITHIALTEDGAKSNVYGKWGLDGFIAALDIALCVRDGVIGFGYLQLDEQKQKKLFNKSVRAFVGANADYKHLAEKVSENSTNYLYDKFRDEFGWQTQRHAQFVGKQNTRILSQQRQKRPREEEGDERPREQQDDERRQDQGDELDRELNAPPTSTPVAGAPARRTYTQTTLPAAKNNNSHLNDPGTVARPITNIE